MLIFADSSVNIQIFGGYYWVIAMTQTFPRHCDSPAGGEAICLVAHYQPNNLHLWNRLLRHFVPCLPAGRLAMTERGECNDGKNGKIAPCLTKQKAHGL
jgi:hypothetical protein